MIKESEKVLGVLLAPQSKTDSAAIAAVEDKVTETPTKSPTNWKKMDSSLEFLETQHCHYLAQRNPYLGLLISRAVR